MWILECYFLRVKRSSNWDCITHKKNSNHITPNQEKVIHVDNVDLAHGLNLDDGMVIVNYLVGKLQEAMGNPLLQADVQRKLQGLQSS